MTTQPNPDTPTPDAIASAYRELARSHYGDDDVDIDDNAGFSVTEDGAWVQAWVYVDRREDLPAGHLEALDRIPLQSRAPVGVAGAHGAAPTTQTAPPTPDSFARDLATLLAAIDRADAADPATLRAAVERLRPLAAPPPREVWVLAINHRHGVDTFAHASEAAAHAQLDDYVQTWWDDEVVGHDMPEDSEERIRLYFGEFVPAESYEIMRHDLPAGEPTTAVVSVKGGAVTDVSIDGACRVEIRDYDTLDGDVRFDAAGRPYGLEVYEGPIEGHAATAAAAKPSTGRDGVAP